MINVKSVLFYGLKREKIMDIDIVMIKVHDYMNKHSVITMQHEGFTWVKKCDMIDICTDVVKANEVSDEELHVILNSLAEQRATPSFQDGFHQGAKWMREQLTKKD